MAASAAAAASSSSSSLRHLLLLRPRLPIPPNPTFPRRLFASPLSSSTMTHGDPSSPSVVDVNPPRGTRDFPPEDMRLRTWLFDHFREVSRVMAFEEVDFPVLESEALFIRKAGEEITQQVLQAVLNMYSIPEHLFTEVCVIVDKLGKQTREEIEKELISTGLSSEAVQGIIEVLSLKSLSKLEEVLGSGVEAVADLKKLFSFAEQYGYADWICFDASVVRGLAYYTGIVFEAFDREGKLRAVCGGGRYDRLLSTFGSEDIPACGFGFGDAVIVELLKEKGLLPLSRQIDDIVFPLDEELEGPASSVASSLRKKGRAVDLVEDKRLKWVFKHAERINASRLILVGKSEWERGMVRVKILSTREEFEVKAGELQ